MPKGYVIVTEAIKDQAGMDAYGRAAAPSMAEAGARVLAVDASPQVLEGQWHEGRTVLVEFPSVEAAQAWYESAAYAEVKVLRLAAADCNGVLLAGFEMPPRQG